MIQLVVPEIPASFDQVVDALRSATTPRAANATLIRFVASRWRVGVVLSVDGDLLRPTLGFGDIAHFDTLSGLEIAREGTGSIAAAARGPVVILQAAADPLLAQLLCGRRDGAAMTLSIPFGLEVRHVIFACDPLQGGLDRVGYALLLHQLGQTLGRLRSGAAGQRSAPGDAPWRVALPGKSDPAARAI